MSHVVRGLGLAVPLALVSILAAPQARAQSTSANLYVQVQGTAGAVYGYSSSSGGQLTAIPGSPFKPGTQIIGATGSQFFTLGKTLLHSYALDSSGAIQAQEFQIPFLDYSGSSCGGGTSGISNAVLDHTGQYIYVLLYNGGSGTCSAYQTYKINGDGSFTFIGDTEVSLPDIAGASTDLPSILGNETFGYADESSGHTNSVLGLQRQSTGALELIGALSPTFSGSANYTPNYPDASPTGNYAVLQLFPNDSNPPQLGSFTIAANGDLSSTNTPANMPTSSLIGPYSTFSPDGTMFALYSSQGPGTQGNGIEIYHFNGASPLTLYKTLLTGTPIDHVAWDKNSHLYAISRQQNKLWVFTVTATSVTQDTSLSIGSPLHMVVVSQTAGTGGSGPCTVPSGVGINVCSPSEGATLTSPVEINATANVSGGVYRFELWSGNTKLVSETQGLIDQSITLAPGTYHLTFDARNSAGDHQYAYRDITVSGSGGACAPPSGEGVNVCSPGENASVTSPVEISAAANVTGGVYRFELWSGSTKLASVSNSGTMNQSVALAAGTYHLTFDARNSAGDHQYATRDITVSAGGAVTQYTAPLINFPTTVHGHVTIDTTGMTTVQVTGLPASQSFTVEFCPTFDANGNYKTPACFNITTVSTNASGAGSSSAKFPQPGDWAGDFFVLDSTAKTVAMTFLDPEFPTLSGQTYMSTLLPESTTNGGVVTTLTGQDPLTSGTVSYSSGTLVITVKGASPNTNYGPVEHDQYLDNSGSYGLAPGITTDAAGNGSTSINLQRQGTEGGDMFTVEGGSAAGYIGGFSIP